MANGILKYTSRDYNSIKEDLVSAIPALTDLWTSREESDPGMVLVKLMSAVGDMISYNFDKQALEYYAPTVTQRKNASKLLDLVGYHMHWYRAAETTLTLNYETEMPEYVSILKQCVDAKSDEEIIDAYYNYRTVYGSDADSISGVKKISTPPITTQDGTQIPLPSKMVEEGVQRPFWIIEQEPLDKENETFINDALYAFAPNAREVFNYWKESQETVIGLHTYIADPAKTLGVYSNNSAAVPYSLIPTTIEPRRYEDGTYDPTITLKPFEPMQLKAIQGTLNSVQFENVQLKENRYYIPETAVDEDHIYVCYTTADSNLDLPEYKFLQKTDNLLTETHIVDEHGNTIIYFEFGVDDFDYPYIELSSYWKNEIPQDGVKFTLYYFKTDGRYGNITKDYLNSISVQDSYLVSVSNVDTNNATYDKYGNKLSSPGKNPQTAHEAYLDSINHIMTYHTLVTIYDFERFTKQQEGITNALAVDGQRLIDFNTATRKVCDSYSKQQLLNILGPNADASATKEELADRLYNIQKVVPIYYKSHVTVEDSIHPGDEGSIESYSLNMYPIYLDFTTTDSEENNVAIFTNLIDTKLFPYYFYKIKTEDDSQTSSETAIATMLDKKYKECQIVNVKPIYTAARVFNWRCCGTIHLTKTVTQEEADLVVTNVINHLSDVYSPINVTFGQKIKYMDVIKTIMDADPRIQYFDAGIGSKKLIDFETIAQGTTPDAMYYNTEAYFNPESIMNYVQTTDQNSSESSPYYNYISVDPNYIQTQSNGQGG